MSYLLDKKIRRKKLLFVFFIVILISALIYFRHGVFRSLAYTGHLIGRPVLIAGHALYGKFSNVTSFFIFKNSLLRENESLKSKLSEEEARLANYNSILDDNQKMKDILGRPEVQNRSLILSSILAKPNSSPYDTMIIDAGIDQGMRMGARVFAYDYVPIGKVSEVYKDSSNVVLFSSPGEKTDVIVSSGPQGGASKSVFLQTVGRGGGNFEVTLIKGLDLPKGTEVVLPGINSYAVGVVDNII